MSSKDDNNKFHQQRCWTCQKAFGGCSWSKVDERTGKVQYKPIPGWIARKVPYRNPDKTYGYTYEIYECPEYVEEPERPDNVKETKMMVLEHIVQLYEAGYLPIEIAEETGMRTKRVVDYLGEARANGLI